MSCSGLHCAGCSAGAAAPVVPLVAVFGVAWVAEYIIEVAIVSAACGVLSVAAVVALMKWGERRDARHAAIWPLLVNREVPAPVLTATVLPQASEGTAAPAIENRYRIRYDPADREAARIIRDAITEGK